jgi:xanthine dehydrogenase accessory factor
MAETRSEHGGATALRFRPLALILGGGDLATGVAARLHRARFGVVVAELAQPRAVRRLVALGEAVYAGRTAIEDLVGVRVAEPSEALGALSEGHIPVLIDPRAEALPILAPDLLVDARMRKVAPELRLQAAPLVIGLGPGFTAGVHCHAVVETRRGHRLGRVLWEGEASPDTGIPEAVEGIAGERVLRSPSAGVMRGLAPLGSSVCKGADVAIVGGSPVRAPFDGVLRGLLHDGLQVSLGEKIGDLDPRPNPRHAWEISDKALAVGGGVLEAALSQASIRHLLGRADAAE